jgi:hypothetical protein
LDEAWVEGVAFDAADCETDHVQPWAAGGLTVDDNGRLACSYHNRRRQRRSEPPP